MTHIEETSTKEPATLPAQPEHLYMEIVHPRTDAA